MEEKVVVNVKSEGEGRLVIESPDGKEETYYLEPIRTMWLEIEMLQLTQQGSSYGFSTDEPWQPLKVSPHLRGRAVLEDRSISVIGEPNNKSRTLAIGFKELNAESLIELQDQAKLNDQAQKEDEDRKFRGVTLGFSRSDWEIGGEDEWWVECYVSPETMQEMVSAVSSNSMRGLSVGLRLCDLYTNDKWSPPSMKVSWFLRPSRRDNSINLPAPAYGEMTSFDLRLAESDLRKSETNQSEDDLELSGDSDMTPTPKTDVKAEAVLALSANVEKLRGTLKWVGGLITFFLMLMAFK